MINKIFDSTLKHYGISGKRLSDVTGISQGHISEFRNGKSNPPCDTLLRLLDGMDEITPGAKRYFCQHLASGSASSLEAVIDTMTGAELSRLLMIIAEKFRQLETTKDGAMRELLSA